MNCPAAPRRALVLVDVQCEYARGPLRIRHPHPDACLDRIEWAIDAAEESGVPVVCVQHSGRPGGPVFDPDRSGFRLDPRIERRRSPEWKSVIKHYGSIYAGTGLAPWLQEQRITTVSLVGFMANNCILASAAQAETLGLDTEVLSDATGAIDLRNQAGAADPEAIHTILMTLLHSNWASVATTDQWCRALARGGPLPGGNLVSSAMAGRL